MNKHSALVEKVARAICSASDLDPDFDYDPLRIAGNNAMRWQLFIPEAMAAIAAVYEALREPSKAMEEAYFQSHANSEWVLASSAECWQAMLSASPIVQEE